VSTEDERARSARLRKHVERLLGPSSRETIENWLASSAVSGASMRACLRRSSAGLARVLEMA
jgi:hypothetical protein